MDLVGSVCQATSHVPFLLLSDNVVKVTVAPRHRGFVVNATFQQPVSSTLDENIKKPKEQN